MRNALRLAELVPSELRLAGGRARLGTVEELWNYLVGFGRSRWASGCWCLSWLSSSWHQENSRREVANSWKRCL